MNITEICLVCVTNGLMTTKIVKIGLEEFGIFYYKCFSMVNFKLLIYEAPSNVEKNCQVLFHDLINLTQENIYE